MPAPYVVFCADPIEPRTPDQSFEEEARAAADLGFARLLVDHDELERGSVDPALRRIPIPSQGPAVYRGWMLCAEAYGDLYGGLAARGVHLINTPEQYAACHHVPEVQAFVSPWTARTEWVEKVRIGDGVSVGEVLGRFGDGAVVVKDWVKSQAAGYWKEACFIPRASDRPSAQSVVSRFLELQGDSLIGGLVFRAYVELAKGGDLVEEWRAFVLDGVVIGCWPRFQGPGDPPPADLLREVAAALPSRFATADFARRVDGGWLLIETGDGQVSGLPLAAKPQDVLKPVAEALSSALGS